MTLRTAALAGIAIALVVAACGGEEADLTPDERLELQEYLAGVDALLDVAVEKFNTDDPLMSLQPLDPPETEAEAIRISLGWYAMFWNDFANDLTDLQPPARAEAAHGNWIEVARTIADANEAALLQPDLESAQSLFEGLEGSQVLACLNMQEIVDNANISVDLNCRFE